MKRVDDKALLKQLRQLGCTICGTNENIDVHHIKTRAAMGDDLWHNLLPLCRKHHNEMHAKGMVTMCSRYPKLFEAISTRGWTYDEVRKKYIHPENLSKV